MFKFYDRSEWVEEIMTANYQECLASAQEAAKEAVDKSSCNGGAVLYFLAECLYNKLEMGCPNEKS